MDSIKLKFEYRNRGPVDSVVCLGYVYKLKVGKESIKLVHCRVDAVIVFEVPQCKLPGLFLIEITKVEIGHIVVTCKDNTFYFGVG